MMIALVLSGFNAQALERWAGERTLHSVTSTRLYAIKVSFTDDHVGRLTTALGPSSFIFNSVKNGLNLFLDDKLSYDSFPLQVNEAACERTGSSEDCSPQQVRVSNDLIRIGLSGSSQKIRITETWRRCAQWSERHIQCENEAVKVDGSFVIEERVTMEPLSMETGRRVAVPLPHDSMAFLRLNEGGSVEVIERAQSADSNIFEALRILSWESAYGRLILHTSNRGRLVYTKTQEYEGVSRVLVNWIENRTEHLFQGALLVDAEVDLSSVSSAAVAGAYRTVSVQTTNQFDLTYEFLASGRGGYEYRSGTSVRPHSMPWSWTWQDEMLQAQSYVFVEGAGRHGLVATHDDLNDCLTSLTTENPICWQRANRQYRILAKDGSRHNMLRVIQFFDHEGTMTRQSLSLWTFYKRN
jgi:hypothetical protein